MPADRMNHLWRSFVLESSKYSLQCIFQDSYHDLFQYGLRITANPEDVKDSIQDLFVSLWLYKNSLATEVNVKAYLLVSLKHQLSRIRSKAQFDLLSEDLEHLLESPEMEQGLDPRVKEMVIRKVNALPSRQKEILYLKYFESLSYEEISQVLNIKYQSVVNQAHRAVTKLRQDQQLHDLAFLRINWS
ncbi:MAG TPA: sigma-70 family RNA polymerase sigma factor [Saprospiraceae bacterium]|nr:sigma-70 family RNA polymerase sigma factor [Saprospiraceae bacterium]